MNNYLLIGGAGFIGTNAADHYLRQGRRVTIYDDLSRKGTEENVAWLRKEYGSKCNVIRGDVRTVSHTLRDLVENAEVVLHLAAQVAVTTSVTDPRTDFEINALGTFNVLEAVRLSSARPVVIYTSTNKVYGKMDDLPIVDLGGRYAYATCPEGIDETRPLDFYSPYGCSKGAGDQYVLDYARTYGLKTVVARQSCIYGPHQFGMEDQGWVAWFAIQALRNRDVTIYGDGKQVRDVLYVGDLIKAYDLAVENIAKTAGQAYNLGGGPSNTLSLRELIDKLEQYFDRPLAYSTEAWRTGDQKVFVSNTGKAKRDFGWSPATEIGAGLNALLSWLQQNERLFALASVAA